VKRFVLALMLAAAAARADTTLVIEAAPAADGPWQLVPIGPEALDLEGGILWQGLPEELKFVRVRVVRPAVEAAHVEPEDELVSPAVVCACDACTGGDETEEGQ